MIIIHHYSPAWKKAGACTMQIEIIKPEALIDLQISPAFLTRLHELLTWMINTQDADAVKQANERISQRQELEEWDEYYSTLLILISSTEEAAKAQGKTEMMDINEPRTP